MRLSHAALIASISLSALAPLAQAAQARQTSKVPHKLTEKEIRSYGGADLSTVQDVAHEQRTLCLKEYQAKTSKKLRLRALEEAKGDLAECVEIQCSDLFYFRGAYRLSQPYLNWSLKIVSRLTPTREEGQAAVDRVSNLSFYEFQTQLDEFTNGLIIDPIKETRAENRTNFDERPIQILKDFEHDFAGYFKKLPGFESLYRNQAFQTVSAMARITKDQRNQEIQPHRTKDFFREAIRQYARAVQLWNQSLAARIAEITQTPNHASLAEELVKDAGAFRSYGAELTSLKQHRFAGFPTSAIPAYARIPVSFKAELSPDYREGRRLKLEGLFEEVGTSLGK